MIQTIILIASITTGVNSGFTQEFESPEACKYAQQEITKTWPYAKTICVPKFKRKDSTHD